MRRTCFVLLCGLLLLPVRAWPQTATSSLRGTVMDPNRAVIPAAEVTLTDPGQGFSRSTKADSAGFFQFLQVRPSTYTLAVKATGFGEWKQNVVLQVSQPATIEVVMAVQAAGTVIEVSGAAEAVNTTDATIGNAFNTNQLINLPSEGRDPVAILSLQPGVVYLGNNVSQVGTDQLLADSRGGSVSGARSDQTNVTLDGLDNNDQVQGLAFEGALRTTLDSLQEFRVTTTNSNADVGRSSGAQVNLVTKSGTNSFHGSLYEYHRPTVTAANDWFNKKAQLAAGEPNRPGKVIRNTFGGTVGGPIIKDRMFFFAAYEGQRRAEAAQGIRTIPSDELRQGILQYPCDNFDDPDIPGNDADPDCSLANPMVRDVNGTLVATLLPADIAAIDQGCLTSNGGAGSCPLGPGPNPAVLTYWNSYPSPNSDSIGDGFNLRGFTFPAANPRKQDTYILKLDYKLSADGNHSLFVRGNLQNDHESTPPQFAGLAPNSFDTNNSKGIAVGYTAILGPNLVNNLRYAFVRQGYGSSGSTTGGTTINFRGVDEPQCVTCFTALVNVPVHNIVNDTTWTKGKHTIQFGTNWRFVTNNHLSNASNISTAVTNAFWTGPAGIANTGTDLDPDTMAGFPAVDPAFSVSYDFAAMALMGLLPEVDVNFTQDKDGNPISNGTLLPRAFKSYEAEFYVQDTWRITPSLTLTGGIRYDLLQPIYENTGNQVCPTFSLDQWFRQRGAAALQGITDSPTISFEPCGNANNRSSYWGWDHKDIGPRVAFAWSPHSDRGVIRALFGTNGVLRGGYGLYYDHFGQGIANTFDQNGSFGLTTLLVNPAGVQDVSCTPRFSSPTTLPTGTLCGQNVSPAAPGFTPPTGTSDGSFAIYWGLDDNLKTPYAHVFNLSFEREIPGDLVFSATYQGRLGRRLLQELDLAQPLNLVDPASGMTYYQAASMLSQFAENGTDINTLAPIPFWENTFPAAAGVGLSFGCATGNNPAANYSATQNIYDLYACFLHNETTALLLLDDPVFGFLGGIGGCFPACSGPTGTDAFRLFDDQFSSLYSWASIGNSSYHGMQLTLRRPMKKGLQFDFNYTFSKSIDIGSNAERVSLFEGFGFGGQVINAWQPNQLRAASDYDLRHQINSNWIYELPFGRGRAMGSGWSKPLDAVLGGWQVSGLFRWTSGFPFTVGGGDGWATNWELQGSSFLTGNPGATGTFIDADGDPNMFSDPTTAINAFRHTQPGESGQRNNLRGPGYFGVDLGVAKRWNLTESTSLGFFWETFNLTNSVRFDAAQGAAQNDFLVASTSFGKYLNTLTRPRVMQFALRLTF